MDTTRVGGSRQMRRVMLLAVLGGLLLSPASAHAVVAATGVIAGADREYTLTVRNTGDQAIQCIQFVAAQGVLLRSVDGPGTIEPNEGFGVSGLNIAPGTEAVWTFTTQDPYPANAGGTLRVSGDCVVDVDAPVSGPAPPPVPQPVVGQTEVATLVSGTVLIRRRGTRRFVRLADPTAIPDRSEIDARRGTVRLTLAQPDGTTETVDVSEGRAVVDQGTGNPAITTLRLSEPLTGCPRATGRATANSAQRRKRKRRQLFASTTSAHVRTQGRYAAAIATGTAWRTIDTCVATTIQVVEGTVRVTDLRRRATASVTAPGRRVVRRRGG
jgi:hypothetical protein